MAEMERVQFDLAFVDANMPDMSGLDLTQEIRSTYPHTDVVVVTSIGSIDIAVEAMKRGATDCVARPLELDRMAALLTQIKTTRDRCSPDGTACPGYPIGEDGFIVGDAPCMRRVFETIEAVKDS